MNIIILILVSIILILIGILIDLKQKKPTQESKLPNDFREFLNKKPSGAQFTLNTLEVYNRLKAIKYNDNDKILLAIIICKKFKKSNREISELIGVNRQKINEIYNSIK